MDDAAHARLLAEQQAFFLPYYRIIVSMHPLGIEAAEVKRIAGEQIIDEFGFDPFDGAISGINPSTDDSRGSQWANNLISNRVLDEEDMIVARGRPTMLSPLLEPSQPVPDQAPPAADPDLGDALRHAADAREPVEAVVGPTTRYLRSPALAEYIRAQAGHRCTIGAPNCTTFTGRDGRPYVEAHHIVPMGQQHHTDFNLDRTANMIALCSRCHLILHRGSRAEAQAKLAALQDAYRESRGVDFAAALDGCEVARAPQDLLDYYAR